MVAARESEDLSPKIINTPITVYNSLSQKIK